MLLDLCDIKPFSSQQQQQQQQSIVLSERARQKEKDKQINKIATAFIGQIAKEVLVSYYGELRTSVMMQQHQNNKLIIIK